MIIRILILIVSIILHILTPHWLIKDFLTIGDWIMIFSLAIGLVFYRIFGANKGVNILTLLLSINCLLYFVMTVQVLPAETYNDWAAYRLLIIFNRTIDISLNTSKVIEGINALQIGLNLLLIVSIGGIVYLRKKRIAS